MISLPERLNIKDADRERLVSFSVDFNSVRNRDRVMALGRYASDGWKQLRQGDPVLVHDSEGNECIAYVEGARGADLFDLRLDWEQWVPSEQPKLRITSPLPAFAGTHPSPVLELH